MVETSCFTYRIKGALTCTELREYCHIYIYIYTLKQFPSAATTSSLDIYFPRIALPCHLNASPTPTDTCHFWPSLYSILHNNAFKRRSFVKGFKALCLHLKIDSLAIRNVVIPESLKACSICLVICNSIFNAAFLPSHTYRFYSAEIICGLQFLHSRGIIYRLAS